MSQLPSRSASDRAWYRLVVSPGLDPRRRAWLADLALEVGDDEDDAALRVCLPDSAALFGLLRRVQDCGIELIEVRRLGALAGPPASPGDDSDLENERKGENIMIHSETVDVRSRLQRWGGGANIVGGVLLAIAYGLHPPTSTPEVVASGSWIVIHVLFMASLLAGIFGLFALLSRYLDQGGGVVGFAATACAVVSLVLILGLDYAEVFIFPVLAVEFPAVVERYGDGTMMPSVAFAFPASGALFWIGYTWLSIELFRRRVLGPVACGIAVAGTTIFVVGLSGLLPMLVVRIGAAAFGLSLIVLGSSLLRSGAKAKSEAGLVERELRA